MAVKCSNDYCDMPATRTLVNGEDVRDLCDDCLAEMAGAFVLENQEVHFVWKDERTVEIV